MGELKSIAAGALNLAYEESGDQSGWPAVLLHGFPYDVRAFDDVVGPLSAAGARVIAPYLRGFGPTRFQASDTGRSGQQAALATDLLALLDALGLEQALLAGFDWGGRAACIVAALHPERVRGLVTQNGYNIQNLAGAPQPIAPAGEARLWYQYYFHSERGRLALSHRRDELCRYLWSDFSPEWRFDDATFARTASSFANPDFVDVVIHSYRHRFGLAPGDPRYAEMEAQIALAPPIVVPTVSLDGESDSLLSVLGGEGHAGRFGGRYEYRRVPGAGHNIPQEASAAFVSAVLTLA